MSTTLTIENIANGTVKSCPISHGEIITDEIVEALADTPMTDEVIAAFNIARSENKPFIMPEGYFHLPIGKDLGLPEGEWLFGELEPLINRLPVSVFKEYTQSPKTAYYSYLDKKGQHPLSFSLLMLKQPSKINIIKQPSNLYCPKVTPPDKPVRLSVKEFGEKSNGTWFKLDNEPYKQFLESDYTPMSLVTTKLAIVIQGYPIYATKPTEYLAWKAKQEGRS